MEKEIKLGEIKPHYNIEEECKSVMNLNEEILNNYKNNPRRKKLKFKYKSQFYICKEESERVLKQGKQFDICEIAKAKSRIQKEIDKISRKEPVNEFIENLYNYYKEFMTRPKPRLRNKIILDSSIIESIIQNNKDKSITLKEIKSKYQEMTGNSMFSLSTMRKWLINNMGYKFRICNMVNSKRFALATRVMIILYLLKLDSLLDNDCSLYCLDESTFCENRKTIKAWSNSKDKMKKINFGRLSSVSIIGIISRSTMHSWEFGCGAINSDAFVKFIQNFEKQLKESKNAEKRLDEGKIYIILDNAAFHASKKTQNKLSKSKINFVFLPVYSPTLSPIEYVWGRVKKRTIKEISKDK